MGFLEAEPLRFSASHLTVQEYYVARAIREEARPLPSFPWRLTSWWANTLTLGTQMGVPFQLGLLHGLGGCEEGGGGAVQNLDLRDGQLGGHRPTALVAISLLMQQVTSLDVSGNDLTPAEAQVISDALMTSKTLTSVAVDDHPKPTYGSDPRVPPGGCVGVGRSPFISGVILRGSLQGLRPALDADGKLMFATSALPVRELRGTIACEHVDCSYKGLGIASSLLVSDLIARNGGLRSLDLSHNALGAPGLRRIVEVLVSNRSVRELQLASNALGVEGAGLVVQLLRESKVISALGLGGNDLGAEGVRLVAEALRLSPTLTSLGLGANGMCDGGRMEGIDELCDALKGHAKMRELDLTDNRLGGRAGEAVAKMLGVNRTLTSLSVGCGNAIGGDAAAALSTAVLTGKAVRLFGGVPVDGLQEDTIEVLDLSPFRVGAPEALLLCSLLRPTLPGPRDPPGDEPLRTESAKSLRLLNLDGCVLPLSDLRGVRPFVQPGAPSRINLSESGLGLASCAVIGCILASNTVMAELSLDRNNIGAEGAAWIADGVRGHPVLRILSLRENNLGVQGAKVIAEALEVNRSITTLRLGSNQVGGHDAFQDCTNAKLAQTLAGPAAIALALAKNSTLTELELESNALRAEGAGKILRALGEANRTLRTLRMDNNKLLAAGGEMVLSMLKENRTLTSINLLSNRIDRRERIKILEAAGERVAVAIETDQDL